MPTTAACPDFAYDAGRDARRRRSACGDAGAILIGKTNLDQFATGLVGVRTPYPVPRNAFDPALVPGGSSSGSAVAVARGLVTFALGTDTAGSGRVPAALNNIVGLKPSRGALSARGVVPACRTLDCVSIFAAHGRRRLARDAGRGGLRRRRSLFAQLASAARRCRRSSASAFPTRASRIFGGERRRAAFDAALALIALGDAPVEIDFAPVLRRRARCSTRAPGWPSAMPRSAISSRRSRTRCTRSRGRSSRARTQLSAADAFDGIYRLAELRREIAARSGTSIDVLIVPSIPDVCTLAEVAAEPIGANRGSAPTPISSICSISAALAVPGPFRARRAAVRRHADRAGRPRRAAGGARRRLHAAAGVTLGATGWPLPPPTPPRRRRRRHDRRSPSSARISPACRSTTSSPHAARAFVRAARRRRPIASSRCPAGRRRGPGMVRATEGGAAIAVEVWALPPEAFGDFVAGVPGAARHRHRRCSTTAPGQGLPVRSGGHRGRRATSPASAAGAPTSPRSRPPEPQVERSGSGVAALRTVCLHPQTVHDLVKQPFGPSLAGASGF